MLIYCRDEIRAEEQLWAWQKAILVKSRGRSETFPRPPPVQVQCQACGGHVIKTHRANVTPFIPTVSSKSKTAGALRTAVCPRGALMMLSSRRRKSAFRGEAGAVIVGLVWGLFSEKSWLTERLPYRESHFPHYCLRTGLATQSSHSLLLLFMLESTIWVESRV